MARIQIQQAVEKIYYNDNDDYIELNFNDGSLPGRFVEMVKRIEAYSSEAQKEYESAVEHSTENAEEQALDAMSLFSTVNERFGKEIDAFFGEGTCRKLWGCDYPTYDNCIGFLEQVTPLFNDYINSMNVRLSKYSPDRMGNV